MNIKTIEVKTGRPYEVLIGKGLLDKTDELLSELKSFSEAVIVSDETVFGIYGYRLVNSLDGAGMRSRVFSFPEGEASKSLETLERLLEFLAQNSVNRKSLLISLGGGVTGDLCGMAAAVYLRGMPYIQIPTTLLAAVDSSVGGKTAVNLKAGKNLVGAFHQPEMVICDCDMLNTLGEGLISDGMAEVIKYGVIADRELFDMASKGWEACDAADIVGRCIEIKADIVSKDEFDMGLRRLLNFGHTPAHAAETLSGYKISHGRAVAMGMALMSSCADNLGISDEVISPHVIKALLANGLPVKTPFPARDLAQCAKNDKKRGGGEIGLVVPRVIGRAEIHHISVDRLEQFFFAGEGAAF